MASKKVNLNNGEILITPEESQNITREKLKKMLPKGTSVSITDEVMKSLHSMEDDTGLPQNLLEEEFMTYTYLLGQKKGVSLMQLINAVKFCNLKRNRNNSQAWAIVFPAKYDELIAAGKPVDNFVSMYSATWLVQEIDKEMSIPVHFQYAGAFHKAMNVNIRMMQGDGGVDSDGEPINVTAMVRHLAAKTILEITRQPEESTLNIKVGQTDEMVQIQQEQADHLAAIVKNQQEQFKKGGRAIDIQKIHMRIDNQNVDAIDAEIEDL